MKPNLSRRVGQGRRLRAAFTLIELLVVIAIIAVLAALVFPALSAARRASYQAPCANNLRQIFASLALYEGDNGALPPAVDTNKVTWDKLLVNGGYMKDTKVLACPADTLPRTAIYNGMQIRSYCLNGRVFEQQVDLPGQPMVPNTMQGRWLRVQKPRNQIVAIFDRPSNVGVYGYPGSILMNDLYVSGKTGEPSPNTFHQTGANYLFGDGHAEYLDFMKTLKGNAVASEKSYWFTQQYFLTQ